MSIKKYINNYNSLFTELDEVEILKNKIKKYKNSSAKKILLFGNGGSSSSCAHIATDLVKVNKIKALSFNDHNLITCFANDYGFENWIKEAIKNFYSNDDFVILISSSGNSKNMLNAAKYCLKKKIKFTSLTGFNKNNPLFKLGKDNIWIDSKSYNYVETAHFQILAYIVDTI